MLVNTGVSDSLGRLFPTITDQKFNRGYNKYSREFCEPSELHYPWPPEPIMIEDYVDKLYSIARKSHTEAKLEIEASNLLSQLLAEHDINYEPRINESLRGSGRSSMSSKRPDSLFGQVVLDYKVPGKLSKASDLRKSKEQIEGYLDDLKYSVQNLANERERLAGILFDGYSLVFCHAGDGRWRWTPVYQVSTGSLMTLVQTYRSLGKEPLSSSLLCRYFGKGSEIAQKAIPTLLHALKNPSPRTTILFKEWLRLFEQAASYDYSQVPGLQSTEYTSGEKPPSSSHVLFALHTYYSIIVKLLTAELLNSIQGTEPYLLISNITNATSYEEVFGYYKNLEDSKFYQRYRINNFLEGDFFSWYLFDQSPELSNSLVQIAHTFARFEPATPKLRPESTKDLLKEFYSGIMDEQIRHDIGEYYTPDWLAQYVLNQVGYNGEIGKVCIDPACGSGTFLVECISLLRRQCDIYELPPRETLREVLASVKGLDLNPLAVISARANYILSIADLILDLGEDVEIPVYLADAINLPVERVDGIYEYPLETEVGPLHLEIPTILVKNQIFGKILLRCENDIDMQRSADDFIDGLRSINEVATNLNADVEQYLRKFYSAIQSLNMRKPPWDSIWCRIVKNNFSPRGFSKADFIIGNPPWVRWSRLPSSYRDRVKKFCKHYGLVSGKGYTGGIESDISTVLVFSAVDNWLKTGGRVGILITWTVFKSDSARGFRIGKLPDGNLISINAIEDLTAIQPFPDATNATGVYIATKIDDSESSQPKLIPLRKWKPIDGARVNDKLSLEEVLTKVEIETGVACPVAEFGSPLYTGSERDLKDVLHLRGNSLYVIRARRGTVTDLSRVFWVKVERYLPETNRAFISTINENELGRAKSIHGTQGTWIDANLLYPLIRGRDVGRFSQKTLGWYQIIPNASYSKADAESVFASKYPATYDYLLDYYELLINRSTYKRYLKDLPFYSIYCIGDYSFAPYKVVWPEQQNPRNFRAAVISSFGDSIIPNRVFVPDHKLYFIGTEDPREAHYLCGFLNSEPARKWLGGFLLSTQIGTSIFEHIKVPMFNNNNPHHNRLAELSEIIHNDRVGIKTNELPIKIYEEELSRLVINVAFEAD